jgi:hypothetical protein
MAAGQELHGTGSRRGIAAVHLCDTAAHVFRSLRQTKGRSGRPMQEDFSQRCESGEVRAMRLLVWTSATGTLDRPGQRRKQNFARAFLAWLPVVKTAVSRSRLGNSLSLQSRARK